MEQPVRQINFRTFLWLCAKETVRTVYDKTDKFATGVGFVIPVIVHFVPQWEHALNSLIWEIPVAGAASVTVVRLVLSPFLIYRRRDLEAQNAEGSVKDLRRSASIKVDLNELHSEPIDYHGEVEFGEWKFDIFLRVRLDLQRPNKVKIANYRFELSMTGLPEYPVIQDDLDQWELYVGYAKDGGAGWTLHNLPPLPMELKAGEPTEGWLHFVTSKTVQRLLEQSVVRLIVQTDEASQYGEHPAEPHFWNAYGHRRITRKKPIHTMAAS